MTRVSWDAASRTYFQGLSQGVLYPKNSPGVPWNGLISVIEKGDDNSSSLYVDGQLYRVRNPPAAFSGTISAFMYPDELEPYIGVSKGITAQPKKSFGLTYRNNLEIHLVYNVLLAPSSDQYKSAGGGVDPVNFQWDFTTTPVNIPGGRPSSHLVVMLDYAQPAAVTALENMIYGDGANDPFLPDPQAVCDMFEPYATMRIVDNNDGTWTATGPDTAIFQGGTIGLFSCAHNNSALCTATFDNVSITPSGGTWTDVDVGDPALAGSASQSGGVFTVTGSGNDIWMAGGQYLDEFHYMYQATPGDCTIVARITSQSNTDVWAKSGVMIKQFTDVGADYVLLAVTPGNGVNFQYDFNGAVSLGAYTFPLWLKLVKTGNLVSSYTSTDGTTWTHRADMTMESDFKINWPTAVMINSDEFTIRSL